MDEKLNDLKDRLRHCGKLAVAFSGGVDSTFLLAVAQEVLGDDVVAVVAESPFMPKREVGAAEAFCDARGIRLIKVEANPLESEGIRKNASDRCHLCKKEIFSLIRDAAQAEGIAVVADGSNADDVSDYRPGMRALEELEIASPLRDAGLTKSDIRALSRDMGLSTWQKPSNACLATRIPYGDELTEEALLRIDAAEAYLKKIDFGQVRVRVHGDIARIEVDPLQVSRLADSSTRRQVAAYLHGLGFTYVTADLDGFRTGSMNEALNGGVDG